MVARTSIFSTEERTIFTSDGAAMHADPVRRELHEDFHRAKEWPASRRGAHDMV